MLLRNSIRLFLRVEKQLLFAVTTPLRSLSTSGLCPNTALNSSDQRKFPDIEPLSEDVQEILECPNPTDSQWSRVYNYFANERQQKKPSPYLEVLKSMKCADERGYLLKAFNLFQYIVKNNHQVNIAEKLTFARICYENRNIITERHKKELEQFYDDVVTSSPYMDERGVVSCLELLSLTNRWKEIEDIIQERSDIPLLREKLLSCLALASFRNNRFDKGWSLIKESINLNYPVQQYVYTDYVEMCSKNKETFKHNMKMMFQIWGASAATPLKEVIAEYVRAFRIQGLQAWYTTILANGQCAKCNGFLRKPYIHPVEQKALADYALKHFIIGSDVYIKSNPKELENLRKFVEASKPYDVVIDGLNIYYKFYRGADQDRRRNIAAMLERLKQNAKGVVVILRRHVANDKRFMKILDGTNIFYTDDLSKDDPFLLYVTWSSEPNAKFISSDLVRDHLAVLPDHKSRMLFTKWMLTHRHYIRANGTLSVCSTFDQVAHNNEDIWHVPYRQTTAPAQYCFLGLEERPRWVCFGFK